MMKNYSKCKTLPLHIDMIFNLEFEECISNYFIVLNRQLIIGSYGFLYLSSLTLVIKIRNISRATTSRRNDPRAKRWPVFLYSLIMLNPGGLAEWHHWVEVQRPL